MSKKSDTKRALWYQVRVLTGAIVKEFPAEARFPAPFQCPADVVIRRVYYYSTARRPGGLGDFAGVYGGGTVGVCT